MPTFDGPNLLIILDSGVTEVDVEVDLYSDWKEFFKTGTNSRFSIAFRTEGGSPVSPTSNSGSYFYLQNQDGWRIRPPEEDINITVSGNLVAEDVTLPIVVPTVGDFTALVLGLQPISEASLVQAPDLALLRKAHTNRQYLVNVGTEAVPIWKWQTYDDDDTTILVDLDHFVEDPDGAQPIVSAGSVARRSKGGLILPP